MYIYNCATEVVNEKSLWLCSVIKVRPFNKKRLFIIGTQKVVFFCPKPMNTKFEDEHTLKILKRKTCKKKRKMKIPLFFVKNRCAFVF